MAVELPDETSRFYRYVRGFDRRLTRWRKKATAHQPPVGFVWILLTFLVLIPLVVGIAWLVQRTHTKYVLLTGQAGHTTALLAPRLQSILNHPEAIERFLHLNIVPDFDLRESCGAMDSMAQMKMGFAQLGFVEDGLPDVPSPASPCARSPVADQAPRHGRETAARTGVVTLLYKSPLHVIARKRLGWKDIQDLPAGAKVYVGPDDSATHVVSRRILDHFGLQVERHGGELDFLQAAQGLLEGRFDVAFFLAALKTPVLTDLLHHHQEVQLLSIGQSAGLKMLFPYLDSLTIPASIYPNGGREIDTVGTTTVLAASGTLRDAEVYEITKKVADHAQELLRDIPLSYAREIDNDPKKELFYRVHDGAHLFFTHDLPFFLDLRTLAGVGTYFSVVSAGMVMLLQFLRHYRVHRLLMVVDRILERPPSSEREQVDAGPLPHLQKVRRMALRLMRRRKISYEEFSRIEDYVKAHRL